MPIFAQHRHVTQRWKALELTFWDLKRWGAPLLGVVSTGEFAVFVNQVVSARQCWMPIYLISRGDKFGGCVKLKN